MSALDRKTFWPCWSAVVAPLFTEQGIAWKGKDAKLGKLKRADGRNILVSVAIHGRVQPHYGGEFLLGIAVSEFEKFEEHHQRNIMPGGVGPQYPNEIEKINTGINKRIHDDLQTHAAGRALLAEHAVSYLLRNPSASSYRFRDDCDLRIWADQFFTSYVPAAIEVARTR